MMERQPFVLAELEDLTPIFSPLKSTSRIKYTCFNVSNNFLMFGATSGGVYVFRREPCVFLQLLPNKEGGITHLAISPDEKLVAYATVRGAVIVLERSPAHLVKHVVSSSEHLGAQITALSWNKSEGEVYIGDDTGRVSILTVAMRNMFQAPSFVLMQLDSRVVQMDLQTELLLVSTLTKCYVCDTAKEIFRQIGHKPREGDYGACIFGSGTEIKLFCARPGSRIWEVAVDGTVISTHHFKQALATPPQPILFQNTTSPVLNNRNTTEQSFNFHRLEIVLSRFIFTFKRDGIYIFDPAKADVVLWNNELHDITDARCVSDVIYVWLATGKMYALNLVLFEKFLIRLYFRKKFTTLGRLCLEHREYLQCLTNEPNKLYLLHDLDVKLRELSNGEQIQNIDAMCEGLRPLLEGFKASAQQRQVQNAQRLQSGIFLIGSETQILAEEYGANAKIYRPNFLNLKGRSHSASPERLKSQGSTSSLPDLGKDEIGKMEEEEDGTPEVCVKEKKQFVESKVEVKEEAPRELRGAPRELRGAPRELRGVRDVCEELEGTQEPTNDLIFKLLDSVLKLAVPNTSNLADVSQPVPLYLHLSDSHVKLVSEVLHSALRSRLVVEWLHGTANPPDNLTTHPAFLLENCSSVTLQQDFKLSKLLHLFSDVLDENQIVDLVEELCGKCYFASLVQVMDKFQDASLSSVSESTLHISNITSRTKTLNIVYFLLRMGQVEKCARYSTKLDLLEILYLILKYEDSLLRGGRSAAAVQLQCFTLFLSYLDKVELPDTWPELVETYATCALERVNASATCESRPHCPCGFPLPSTSSSSTVVMFGDIGQVMLNRSTPSERLFLCSRVPQLWRQLVNLRRGDPLISVLPLLLQLNDTDELEARLYEMDAMLFEVALRHLIGLRNGNCLNCGRKLEGGRPNVPFTALGLLCVKSLGPRSATELFEKYASDIAVSETGKCFFQAAIFSAIMEKHSKGLRKNVVELLTSENTLSTPTALTEDSLRKAWGVKLNGKSPCSVCRLPLSSEVLVSDGGLISFKCSHCCHAACLNKVDPVCPVCSK